MKCAKCGQEMDASGRCPYCDPVGSPEVRVMSKEEKNLYTGVTIDESIDDTVHRQENHAYTKQRNRAKVFFKNFNSDSFGSNWMTKIAVLLLVASVVGFIVFIALPVALIGIAIGAVVWFLLSFLRH